MFLLNSFRKSEILVQFPLIPATIFYILDFYFVDKNEMIKISFVFYVFVLSLHTPRRYRGIASLNTR